MSGHLSQRRSVLPTGSTALERAIEQVTPVWDALAQAAHPAPDGTPPPLFAPWLAAEWQLARFAPYFSDVQALLAAGLPWLMQRGSAASVQAALGWLGFGAAQPEEDGPYLHIRLDRIPSPGQVPAIAHVVRASLPAHVRLWRLYWGHDARTLRLDGGPALDAGMLDNDSGVWLPAPGGPHLLASFGTHRRAALPRPVASRAGSRPQVLRLHARVARMTYDDRLILDAWRLDSRLLVDAFGGVGELYSHGVPAPARRQPASSASHPHHTRTHLCAWQAARPARAHHTATLRAAPSPLPAPRAWDGGTWRNGRWRALVIQRKHTQESN